ncbi:MAG: hypothetical protein ACOVS5_06655 [Oligoflexus sp.]|jgi:hypothetical protein
MDFVPEIVDGAVILNAADICTYGNDCRPCSELAVGVHNWLVAHQLRYLIVDFQDEKDVCMSILTELLQLRKRLRYPFFFCGLMEGPKKFLESYACTDYPFFPIPEEAVSFLKKSFPKVLMADLSAIKLGEPIPCTRSRSYRAEGLEDIEVEESDVETEV